MTEDAAEYEQHAQNIDAAVAVILDLLTIGAKFYPPLAAAIPFLSMFIKYEAHKLKGGLADGTIVPDGHGGLVPITNSRYDPKTGRFL